MSDALNVTTAKPKIGGAVNKAPLGTALPTDATSTLNVAFKNLGYISEDGVTNTPTIDSEDIKAWGGDIVETSQTGKTDEFKFTLLESLMAEVRKVVYGDENVTGTLETGIVTKANSKELQSHCWVFDTVLKGDALHRIVIPNGKVSEIGDIVYKDGEAVGYEITLKAMPSADLDGDTHREYTVQAD